jgi:Uma2 family endonuclease
MNALLHLDPESPPRSMVWDQPLSNEQFEALCLANDFFILERTRDGEIIVNTPAGGSTGDGNSEINHQLRAWWKTHRRGRVFDSSTGFFLADSAMLNPDAAYLLPETMKGIGKREMEHFLYRCPDFVIELLSKSDRLNEAKAKMERWIENGAKLGWLIDPYQRRAFVYGPSGKPTVISGNSVPGSGPVFGFTLDLSEVWSCYEI